MRPQEGKAPRGPVKKAVIDVGTNSVKYCLAEGQEGRFRILDDRVEIARLGEGLGASGQISAEALERNLKALEGFVARARGAGASEIAAVGTMALRTASNAGEFLKALKERTNLDLKVLSGEEEARLSYRAVMTLPGALKGRLVSFDTGGGSTEFAFCRDGKVKRQFSLDLGAVTATEAFFPTSPVEPGRLQWAMAALKRALKKGGLWGYGNALVGIGGSVTTLASVKLGLRRYAPEAVQGTVLTCQDLDCQIELYSSCSLSQRRKIPGLAPMRADVILAGACIVKAVMELLHRKSCTVSARSLRHGLLEELFAWSRQY